MLLVIRIVIAATVAASASAGSAQESGAVKRAPPAKPDPAHTAPATATPEVGQQENRRTLAEQYGGVITNNTITVAGQDFFKEFSFFWREKPNNERFALSVHERPSARLGNQVWVEYNNTRVFQTVLPTLRAQIGRIADVAAANTYQTVTDLEVQRMLFRDADLGPDEF